MLLEYYQQSRGSGPPLRIGLLLDSPVLLRCFGEIIDQIQASNFARLELLVYNSAAQQTAAQGPEKPLWRKRLDLFTDTKRRRALAYSLYQRFDRRNAPAPPDDPRAFVDCSDRLAGITSLRVIPETRGPVHRFPADALETIRHYQLDVLIRFGFNILRGGILTASRYGVWSYHHGDNDYYRGGPPYFWEIYENNPISGAILQVLTEELDAGKVLYKGLFATSPGLSHVRNQFQPYWGACTFLIQKLRELHERGWEHLERNMVSPAPYQGKKKIYKAPTNSEIVRWLGPEILRRSVRRVVRRPALKHWRMALRTGTNSILDSTSQPDLDGFRWLESPPGRFYADPFLMEVSGQPWLFFEDYDYTLQRAKLSCAPISAGKLGTSVTVLEQSYHLSYPCVFESEGNLYLIPESQSNGTIDLYRCTRFPDRWEKDRELFRAKAVDTTAFQANGLYWFFTTIKDPRGGAIQLWLFYARSLADPWTPHPANPISTDVRNARGAGAVVRHQGKLFRPSQDCSSHYGFSFTLNEIVALDPDKYEEAPGVTVLPSWSPGLIATHTYSRLGEIEVIDGCALLPPGRVKCGLE